MLKRFIHLTILASVLALSSQNIWAESKYWWFVQTSYKDVFLAGSFDRATGCHQSAQAYVTHTYSNPSWPRLYVSSVLSDNGWQCIVDTVWPDGKGGDRWYLTMDDMRLDPIAPALPKDNGNSCPSCGEPINPGNGNMWHVEVDYVGVAAAGNLGLIRTYNSNPNSNNSTTSNGFGPHWSYSFGSAVAIEPNSNSSSPIRTQRCWRNAQTFMNTNIVTCDTPMYSSGAIPQTISISRSDGKKYFFNFDGNTWNGDSDVNDRVKPTFNDDHSAVVGWTYVSAQGDIVENYDGSGLLISVMNRNGMQQRYTYSSGETNDSSVSRYPTDAPVCANVPKGEVLPASKLLCVTDNWGRQVQFEYDSKGRISKAVDPNGGAYSYAYDGPSGGCSSSSAPDSPACSANNLTSVTYPDGRARTYYYNEATNINNGSSCPDMLHSSPATTWSLTGLGDENGSRYITWSYDCVGHATSSRVGSGVEKVVLSYTGLDVDGATTSSAVVTYYAGTGSSPQSTTSTFQYQQILGRAKNTSISSSCVECGPYKSRTYDANGNIASTTDWKNNVTKYTYDLARNLELSRVEASGTAQARTITTQWHATYRLPVRIAEPKRITTFSYNDKGNLLSKTEQETTDVTGAAGFGSTQTGTSRSWSYTYNNVGQTLTATDPLNNSTGYEYDSQGNLVKVTNAAGQATCLSNYDANGRVGRITDPNGLITDLTYSPRGWLASKTVGGETTSYDYDGVGQMTKVTNPDGSYIRYSYDDAHRLTDITDSLGNSIHYTLDLRGNRINEEVKDTSGVLARQTTRVYNALNWLQQITGGVR